MACDSFMFFKVNRRSASMIKEASRLPKYYFIDNGMRNAVVLPQSDDDGKLLENIVFLHLRRHLDPSYKISYFSEGVACDFVVRSRERIEALLQVCYRLSDSDTLQRELRGLQVALRVTGCRNCMIITLDEERQISLDGDEIRVIPAWKWLLSNPIEEIQRGL